MLPVVVGLLEQHSDLDIRMMLIDRNVRMPEEGIDMAVRIGPLADSALIAVPIGQVRQKIVASPAYLARHGHPHQPSNLSDHQIIGSSGPRAVSDWNLGQKKERPVRIKPRLLLNTVDSIVAAAEAGLGVANLLSYQVEKSIRAGRLIEILKPGDPTPLPIHLLFERSRRSLPATRLLIDAMKNHALDQRLHRID
ncbi:MAG: LysR substrate-binding domain-containing protein [Parasphingorhabdus sp.]